MSKYLPTDRLLCYQLLFINDITTAEVEKEEPLILKTKRNRLFQRAKFTGIIVSLQHNVNDHTGKRMRCILQVDDGTATITVHLTQRVFETKGYSMLKISAWITILGEIQDVDNLRIVVGKGYYIHFDPIVEVSHWLKVLVNDKNKMEEQGPLAPPLPDGNKRQKRSESSVFASLSSQPSPIRGSTEDLYPSPIKANENATVSCSQITREAPWHWSPDHIAATSTPIMQYYFGSPRKKSLLSSPLRITETAIVTQISSSVQPNNNMDDKDDDDDFGFADDSEFGAVDFDEMERKAWEHRR